MSHLSSSTGLYQLKVTVLQKILILPKKWKTPEIIGIIELASIHLSSQLHSFPRSQIFGAEIPFHLARYLCYKNSLWEKISQLKLTFYYDEQPDPSLRQHCVCESVPESPKLLG